MKKSCEPILEGRGFIRRAEVYKDGMWSEGRFVAYANDYNTRNSHGRGLLWFTKTSRLKAEAIRGLARKLGNAKNNTDSS